MPQGSATTARHQGALSAHNRFVPLGARYMPASSYRRPEPGHWKLAATDLEYEVTRVKSPVLGRDLNPMGRGDGTYYCNGGNIMGGSVAIRAAKPVFLGENAWGYGDSINNQGLGGGGGGQEHIDRIVRANSECGVYVVTCPTYKTYCGDPCAGIDTSDVNEFCCKCLPKICGGCAEGGCSPEIGCCISFREEWHQKCGNPGDEEDAPCFAHRPSPQSAGYILGAPRRPWNLTIATGTATRSWWLGVPTVVGAPLLLGLFGPSVPAGGRVFGNMWPPFSLERPYFNFGRRLLPGKYAHIDVMIAFLPAFWILLIGLGIILLPSCGGKEQAPEEPDWQDPENLEEIIGWILALMRSELSEKITDESLERFCDWLKEYALSHGKPGGGASPPEIHLPGIQSEWLQDAYCCCLEVDFEHRHTGPEQPDIPGQERAYKEWKECMEEAARKRVGGNGR